MQYFVLLMLSGKVHPFVQDREDCLFLKSSIRQTMKHQVACSPYLGVMVVENRRRPRLKVATKVLQVVRRRVLETFNDVVKANCKVLVRCKRYQTKSTRQSNGALLMKQLHILRTSYHVKMDRLEDILWNRHDGRRPPGKCYKQR